MEGADNRSRECCQAGHGLNQDSSTVQGATRKSFSRSASSIGFPDATGRCQQAERSRGRLSFGYSIHFVYEWITNTPAMAARHYLTVREGTISGRQPQALQKAAYEWR
jgi:hypothetical protein